MALRYDKPFKGRGAGSNPDNRFEIQARERVDDGWDSLEQTETAPQTTLSIDYSRTVITYNQSPDVGFDRSINPYRGCEHGCVYCFARPSHAYLGLSPGLDFESRLFYKPDAPEQLRRELGKHNYRAAPIALGINTDAYQPVERRAGLTRRILQVLAETRHPVTIVTKSKLIERDLDILTEMAADNLCQVAVSITTLDSKLSRRLEPRTTAPARRMETVARLAAAGVPVSVMVAPLIPVLTDAELESLLTAARDAGAHDAAYVLLRLPHEIKTLFADWLEMHEPLKAEHVLNRVRDCRGGKDYDARFGHRMRGTGVFADLIAQRYRKAMRKLAFPGTPPLECGLFRLPREAGPQLALFD